MRTALTFCLAISLLHLLPKSAVSAAPAPAVPIKSTITGQLNWRDAGGGYYVRVLPKEDSKSERRVFLLVGEDKVTGRKLEELKGREVVAAGTLQLTPPASEGSVSVFPPMTLYLKDFEFEAAKPK